MKKMIILFLLMMMVCPSSAELTTVNDVSTMNELLIAINNSSVLAFSDGYYIVYEQINVTTISFTITNNTKIDTYAFLDINSPLLTSDCAIKGFESGRKPRTNSRYITSGYVIVRGNLTMNNTYVRGLGSEYRAARYNPGITIYGNSDIKNSVFEYVKYITVISEKTILNDVYHTIVFRDTINTFSNNTFERSDAIIYNSVGVLFDNCIFDNSKMRAHNCDARTDSKGIGVESCTFTDTDDRPDGDGHYSGVYGHWANTHIKNSTFNDCNIQSENRPTEIENCTLVDGDIVLNTADYSHVSNSTLIRGSILMSGGGGGTRIHNNDISGDYYGIRVGTIAAHGTSAISQMDVFNNTIHNTAIGIAILNAHGNGYVSNFHHNHIYNSNLAMYTHGDSVTYSWRNTIHDNVLDGDVDIANRDQSLINNTIIGNATITSNDNTAHDNNVSGYIKLMGVAIGVIVSNNTADTIHIINCDSAVCDVIGNINNTNDKGFLDSCEMLGGIRITHNEIYNIVINSSMNITNLSVYAPASVYNVTKDGILFDTITPMNDTLIFVPPLAQGNYSIFETVLVNETEQSESGETHTQSNGRNEPLIVQPRNDTTINVTTDNTTSVVNDTAVNVAQNNTTTTTEPTIHDDEKETVSMIWRIINWIRNLFGF